jgi:SAM-dependent methyltransferase
MGRLYKISNYFNWQINRPINLRNKNSTHLDLGSGSRPANPFDCDSLIASDVYRISYDIKENFNSIIIRNFKIQISDATIDSVSAYDVIEHIPRSSQASNGDMENPFILIMNEVSRILKPGGIFIAVTPSFPSPVAFQDPTHVNFITKNTANYFAGPAWSKDLGYGFTGNFEIIQNCWLFGQAPHVGKLELGEKSINNYPILNNGIKFYLKLIKRTLKLIRPRKKTHILWVFKKCN